MAQQLSVEEQRDLDIALAEIRRERFKSLGEMFRGTQLQRRGLAKDAEEAKKAAEEAKKVLKAVPGLDVSADFNFDLFKGINLKNLKIPTYDLGRPWNLIPDINIGSLPGFSLPSINIPGLQFPDLLPNISLRFLVWNIGIKFPHINLPSLTFDISKLLNINWPDWPELPRIEAEFPEWPWDLNIDLRVDLPDFPDVNFPKLPDFPHLNIDLPQLRLALPEFEWDKYLKIPGFRDLLKLLAELVDSVDLPDILGELGSQFLNDFVASALPIIGQLKTGAKAANSWRKAAKDAYHSHKTTKAKAVVVPGHAAGACTALSNMLKESSKDNAARATIETTQLAISSGALFTDAGLGSGPLISAAAALGKLAIQIHRFSLEYKAYKNVNLMLKHYRTENLGIELFTTCPLLACYYIANNTTSNVVNCLSDDLMQDNWMDDVEKNIKNYINPLVKNSQQFIANSRYVLRPLRQDKGMYIKCSRMERWKNAFKLSVKKKFGYASKDATVKTHKFIG
jgi:hypothetical protein